MHQSNFSYHRVSSAVVCIFLMKLLGWFCCKQYTLTHPSTHFVYSYCIYKLCLKLLWTCHKNWASVRFAMQPTTVCQISSSFFLVARAFHKWKIIWIMRVLRHLHIFRSVCVWVCPYDDSTWPYCQSICKPESCFPCSSRLPLFCCYFLPSETFDF